MQRGDYLQTAGAQSRKRRVGGVLLRTCHISGGVGGQAGQAGQGEERQAFIDTTAKTFSNNCWPLLRHFFFRMGLRKSWRGAWSASFQCRLCRDNKRVSLQLTWQVWWQQSWAAQRPTIILVKLKFSWELKLRSCARLLFSGSFPIISLTCVYWCVFKPFGCSPAGIS